MTVMEPLHGALLMMGGLLAVMTVGLIFREYFLRRWAAQARAQATSLRAPPASAQADLESGICKANGSIEANVEPDVASIVWEAGKLAGLAEDDGLDLDEIEGDDSSDGGATTLAEVDWPVEHHSPISAAASAALAAERSLAGAPPLPLHRPAAAPAVVPGNPHHVGAAANASDEDVAMLNDIRAEAALRSRGEGREPKEEEDNSSPEPSLAPTSSRAPTDASSQRWRQKPKKKQPSKGKRRAPEADSGTTQQPSCGFKVDDDPLAC